MDKDAEIGTNGTAPMTEAMEASEGQCERCDASLASHLLLINEINYIISENRIYSLRHLHTVATAASSRQISMLAVAL